MGSTISCQVSSPAMARLSLMIAVLKPFSSRYALSALRSASASSPASVRILQKWSSTRKIRFSMEGDSHVSICTKIRTNFVQCLFVVHIIGCRVSGNQDQNLVRQDRSLRWGTIAEHSQKLAWHTLIDIQHESSRSGVKSHRSAEGPLAPCQIRKIATGSPSSSNL